MTAPSGIRFPLALPANPVVRRIKTGLGRLLLPVMAARARRLLDVGLPAEPSILDWILVAGLIDRHERQGTAERLTPLHRWLWSGAAAVPFHDMAAERFERWWLPHHSLIADPMRRIAEELKLERLYEIGCGCGRVLNDVIERTPQLREGIGLDLCPTQVNRVCRAFADNPRLSFACGDAIEWIPHNARLHSLFFTNAGVLEYLPATSLQCLLRDCAQRFAPCGFAIVEPLAPDFDLERATQSRVYGTEHSLCHPYPHYFREAGFDIRFQEEQQVDGFRWLLLVGTATRVPASRPSGIH